MLLCDLLAVWLWFGTDSLCRQYPAHQRLSSVCAVWLLLPAVCLASAACTSSFDAKSTMLHSSCRSTRLFGACVWVQCVRLLCLCDNAGMLQVLWLPCCNNNSCSLFVEAVAVHPQTAACQLNYWFASPTAALAFYHKLTHTSPCSGMVLCTAAWCESNVKGGCPLDPSCANHSPTQCMVQLGFAATIWVDVGSSCSLQ